MTRPTPAQTTAISDALAPIVAIVMAGLACLAVMDLAGINVGICLSVAVKVVWGFVWRGFIIGCVVGLFAWLVASVEAGSR